MHRLLKFEEGSSGSPSSRFTASSAVSFVLAAALLGWLGLHVEWSFVSELDFLALLPYSTALLRGLSLTLLISVLAIVTGLVIGTVLAVLLQLPLRLVRWIVKVYVEIARNTPLIVSLFWVHFALPHLTGINTTALQSGIIAIVFQASGYLADISRAGIQAVPRGQFEACYATGLSARTKWITVILPQALKVMIPPLVNVSISFFKATSILSVITVGELMNTGLRVSESNFRPIETLTFCGLVYIVLGTLFSRATQVLERLSEERTRNRARAQA
jgi:polar amino acid transport system permease protein